MLVWNSANISQEGENEKTQDGDDLDGGKPKLGFTVNFDSKNVQAEYDEPLQLEC